MKRIFILILITVLPFIIMLYASIDASIEYEFRNIKINDNSQKNDDSILSGSETGKKEREFIGQLKNIKTFEIAHKISKWIYKKNIIYCFDNIDQKFYLYNENFKIISEFGEKGEAPWEANDVVNFEITDSTINIIDYGKQSVKNCPIPIKQKVNYYYKFKNNFWTGTKLNNNLYLFLIEDYKTPDGDFSFDIIEMPSNNVIKSYDFKNIATISPKQRYINVAYEGFFCKNEGFIFYVCSKAGLFLCFNSNGEFIYKTETIDESPAPKIRTKTDGNLTFYIREPDYSINYSMTTDNYYLYILSLIRFIKSDQLVIDIYNVSNGIYAGSYEVPNFDEQLPVRILKTSSNLFIMYEDLTVIKYKIDLNYEK